MCGRYLLDDEAYADILIILNNLNKEKRIYTNDDFMSESYARGEIFPTFNVPVIERDNITSVKWGFPHWKNSSVIINARAETASIKNMFRKPLRERRCVVPSSGFYEWSRNKETQKGRKQKEKYLFKIEGEHMVYMAGIVNTFRDPLGEFYDAFTILTTSANDSIATIHDRMPILLAKDEFDSWINDDSFTHIALNRIGQELSATVA